jgi:hypothetical protein
MVLTEPSSLGIANLKLLLLFFEHMSGLKINFDKIKIFLPGFTKREQCRVANMLNYKLGKFPMIYLSLPVGGRPLSVAD